MGMWCETKEGAYESTDGECIQREQDTLTPGGNKLSGRWAYRDRFGRLIDFDGYRNDLFERNGIRIIK